MKVYGTNKRAKFNYFILSEYEAGMVLAGSEVKSVRAGQFSLLDGYVRIRDGEAYLLNTYIAPYGFADNRNYFERRERKLLLHKKEIKKLEQEVNGKNITIVPLRVYDRNNSLKVEIGVGKGKKQYDKREALKKRDLDAKVKAEISFRKK